jgi:hypothetical protein
MPSSHRRYRDWTHERIRHEAQALSLPPFAFTPQTNRSVISPSHAEPHGNHQVSTGRSARCVHCRRSSRRGPDPDPAARPMERKTRRRRRLRDAQRVQWRLRLERLRSAEGVCLCITE